MEMQKAKIKQNTLEEEEKLGGLALSVARLILNLE